jgi:hypothetical protein
LSNLFNKIPAGAYIDSVDNKRARGGPC